MVQRKINVIEYFGYASWKVICSLVSFEKRTLSTMESLYKIPFSVLECPSLRLRRPPWLKMPSGMVVFAAVLLSYFLVTGGKLSFLTTIPYGLLLILLVSSDDVACQKLV